MTEVNVIYFLRGETALRAGYQPRDEDAPDISTDPCLIDAPGTIIEASVSELNLDPDATFYFFYVPPLMHLTPDAQALVQKHNMVDLRVALKRVFNVEYRSYTAEGLYPLDRAQLLFETVRDIASEIRVAPDIIFHKSHDYIAEQLIRSTIGYVPEQSAPAVSDKKRKRTDVKGGHVFDVTPGLHVASGTTRLQLYDFESHYPTIIVEERLLRNYLQVRTPADAASVEERLKGTIERRRRISHDQKAKRDALKLLGNSNYGTYAMASSKLYNPELANQITAHGRERLQRASSRCEELGGTRLFGQTDSIIVITNGADGFDEGPANKLIWGNLKLEETFSLIWIVDKQRYSALLKPLTDGSDEAVGLANFVETSLRLRRADAERALRRSLKRWVRVPGLLRGDRPLAYNTMRILITIELLQSLYQRQHIELFDAAAIPKITGTEWWTSWVSPPSSTTAPNWHHFSSYYERMGGDTANLRPRDVRQIGSLPVITLGDGTTQPPNAGPQESLTTHSETVGYWMDHLRKTLLKDLEKTRSLATEQRTIAAQVLERWIPADVYPPIKTVARSRAKSTRDSPHFVDFLAPFRGIAAEFDTPTEARLDACRNAFAKAVDATGAGKEAALSEMLALCDPTVTLDARNLTHRKYREALELPHVVKWKALYEELRDSIWN